MKIFINEQLAKTTYRPAYATEFSAGIDIPFLTYQYHEQSETYIVSTGVHVDIPQGYYGMLVLRSSASKWLGVYMRSPGIIDSDYRGEVLIPLTEVFDGSNALESLNPGDRIAQLIIQPYITVPIEVVSVQDELSKTVRGQGGFGSTGVS
jgi:dUTP pyrophosphatase